MVPTLPAKVLSIKGRAAAEKAIKPPPATSPIVAAPTKKKRLKAKRAKKAKAKANLNSEVINVLDSEDDEEAKANGAGEAIVSFNGGRDLASPEAGPSRITLDVICTAQTPSAFVPLRRSMLSGMSRISASPERKIEGKTANGIQFMIDDTPSRPSAANTSGSRTPVVSEHFQPPPLFSASLPTSNGAATSEGVSDGKPNTGSEDITTGANLMLPQHVSLSDKPVENAIVDDSGDPEDDSMEGLHFLDDDKVRGVQRYFDPSEQTEEASFLANADQSKICPNCKKPGHRQYQCPHVVCTTCGAMDEHERRDCPHGLVCFGCGQRGHRQSDCPDPVSRASRKRGCDRCGSREHPESSCPTLWRVYAYWSTSQRADMLEGKRKAEGWAREAIGGDEYEEWCYNCAKSGHLGDDCPRQRASQARLFFPSAFSHSMASRGPFFSQTRLQKLMEATPVHARWDDDDSPLPYVTPKFGGLNAGKKTADKAKRAMIDREAGEIDEDDEDDWFNARRGEPSQRGISIRGRGKSTPMAGGRRPWDSENRPGVGKAKATGREPLPFSHSHLMASAPASSKGKGIQFGKLSLPETPNGSNNDSPTAKQAKKRGVGQSGNLLSRALENSSREAGSRSGSPMVKGPTSSSVPPSDSSDGSSSTKKRRKKRKEANDEQDRDPESRWWESGNGGGKVTSWGRELDKSDAGLKEKKKPATSGQRYVGGY